MAAAPAHLLYPTKRADLAEHCRQAVRLAMGAPHVPHIPVSNPVSMDRRNMAYLGQEEYMVALKADGVRYLLVLTHFDGMHVAAMVDRAGAVYTVHAQGAATLFLRGCVFDGELCECRTDKTAFDFLVFDALVVRGTPFRDQAYRTRIAEVRALFARRPLTMDDRRHLGASAIVPASPALNFMVKGTESASRLRGFRARADVRYRTDGFIFTPAGRGVRRGRDERLLKWKEDNPIDVRLVVQGSCTSGARLFLDRHGVDVPIEEALDGQFNHIVLDVATSANFASILQGAAVYARIFRASGVVDFDKVVEMGCDILPALGAPAGSEDADRPDLRLTFRRLRPDKRCPNEVDTVQRTLHTIRDNITFPDLCALVETCHESRVQ